jgi:hypothetical protein
VIINSCLEKSTSVYVKGEIFPPPDVGVKKPRLAGRMQEIRKSAGGARMKKPPGGG